MKYDNPAARLLEILERGKKFEPKRNCRECWEELLNARGDAALLMARIGKIMELPRLAIQAIEEAYPAQAGTWSHWENTVSAAFMVQNMHAEWATFANNLDHHTINYLRLAAELLYNKDQSRLLEVAQVNTVREQVHAALDAALAAELPPPLRLQISRCLRNLIQALDEYQITGAITVLHAAEVVLGHASLDTEYKSFLTDTEVGKRVLDAIAAAANLITVSIGIPQLSAAVTQLLAR